MGSRRTSNCKGGSRFLAALGMTTRKAKAKAKQKPRQNKSQAKLGDGEGVFEAGALGGEEFGSGFGDVHVVFEADAEGFGVVG